MTETTKLLVAFIACYTFAAINIILALMRGFGPVDVFSYIAAVAAIAAGTYAFRTWRELS